MTRSAMQALFPDLPADLGAPEPPSGIAAHIPTRRTNANQPDPLAIALKPFGRAE